jgi:hypothetical protein
MKRVACILAVITFFAAFAQDIEDIPTIVEPLSDTVITEIDTIPETVPDFTTWTYTADDIKRMPVTTLYDILFLQPGIVESETGLHLRGGGTDDIGYHVDGIETDIPLPLSVIEELIVLPNPIDAEYGNALAGIVDITTKKLTSRPAGTFRYVNDNPFSGEPLDRGYDQYEACFQGLLAPYASFTLAGNMTNTDAFQQALYKVPSPKEDYTVFGSVTLQVTKDRGYITFSGARSRDQYVVWTPYTAPGNRLKYFYQRPMSRTKRSLVAVSFDLHPFANTDFSVDIGVNKSESVYGNRDYKWEDSLGRAWYDDYRLKDEHFIDALINGEIPARDILVDSLSYHHEEWSSYGSEALRLSPFATTGFFRLTGFFPEWEYEGLEDKQIHAKITQTITPWYDAELGFDYTSFDVKHYATSYYVGMWPMPIDTIWEYYERIPHEYGTYLNNRLYLNKINIDIGVRFDNFQPNAFTYTVPDDFQDSTILDAEPHSMFSPRLAVSFLPTNHLLTWIRYGHYYQMPSFEQLYVNTDVDVIREAITWASWKYVIGNIHLNPVRLNKFELGATYENPYNITITALYFHKDQIGKTGIDISDPPYLHYANSDTAWIAGFEFHIEKPVTHVCSFGFDFIHQMARISDSTAILPIEDNWYYWWWYYDNFLHNYKLDNDAWLSMKGHIDFASPDYVHNSLIKNLTASLVFVYHSGLPYSPLRPDGSIIGYNSFHMPGYWNMDLKIGKGIRMGPAKLVLTAFFMNLFNISQVVDVHNITGLPDDHGYADPAIGQFGYVPITSDRYSPQADFDHSGLITPVEYYNDYIAARDDFYDDPTNWKNPFRFLLGVGIEF